MVARRLQMYWFIGHRPAISNVSSTNDHYHPYSPTCRSDTPHILRTTQWWNPSISVTTQLSILYSKNDCITPLNIISLYCTVAPVFINTFFTTPHRRWAFLRLPYIASQSLLLNSNVQTKCGKASVESSGFTLINPKKCCSISLLLCNLSPIQHCYVVSCWSFSIQGGTWRPQCL